MSTWLHHDLSSVYTPPDLASTWWFSGSFYFFLIIFRFGPRVLQRQSIPINVFIHRRVHPSWRELNSLAQCWRSSIMTISILKIQHLSFRGSAFSSRPGTINIYVCPFASLNSSILGRRATIRFCVAFLQLEPDKEAPHALCDLSWSEATGRLP